MCSEGPMKLKGHFESGNGTFYVYSENMIVTITEVRTNYYPIVADIVLSAEKKYSQRMESVKSLAHNESAIRKTIRLSFHEFVYFVAINGLRDGQQRLLGFNNVWLGCPQPLCLWPSVDTITGSKQDKVYLFRGRFYWDLEDKGPPLVKDAQLISKQWTDLFPYLDASYTDRNGNVVFFKESNVYVYSHTRLLKTLALKEFDLMSTRIDAAVYVVASDPLDDLIYIFKDDWFWSLSRNLSFHRYPTRTNRISKSFPKAVDATFLAGETVYFFKGWYYYTAVVQEFVNHDVKLKMEPLHPMIDLFNCDNELYTELGFISYQQYLSKLIPFTKNHPPHVWTLPILENPKALNYKRYEKESLKQLNKKGVSPLKEKPKPVVITHKPEPSPVSSPEADGQCEMAYQLSELKEEILAFVRAENKKVSYWKWAELIELWLLPVLVIISFLLAVEHQRKLHHSEERLTALEAIAGTTKKEQHASKQIKDLTKTVQQHQRDIEALKAAVARLQSINEKEEKGDKSPSSAKKSSKGSKKKGGTCKQC